MATTLIVGSALLTSPAYRKMRKHHARKSWCPETPATTTCRGRGWPVAQSMVVVGSATRRLKNLFLWIGQIFVAWGNVENFLAVVLDPHHDADATNFNPVELWWISCGEPCG